MFLFIMPKKEIREYIYMIKKQIFLKIAPRKTKISINFY